MFSIGRYISSPSCGKLSRPGAHAFYTIRCKRHHTIYIRYVRHTTYPVRRALIGPIIRRRVLPVRRRLDVSHGLGLLLYVGLLRHLHDGRCGDDHGSLAHSHALGVHHTGAHCLQDDVHLPLLCLAHFYYLVLKGVELFANHCSVLRVPVHLEHNNQAIQQRTEALMHRLPLLLSGRGDTRGRSEGIHYGQHLLNELSFVPLHPPLLLRIPLLHKIRHLRLHDEVAVLSRLGDLVAQGGQAFSLRA
mmetsp:Transcript_34062/g.73600  ORF Transcript_34062/g.73600 Transcript_34062/m.73600 type:complete len:246 (+) Transcript_34062:98-835(+)